MGGGGESSYFEARVPAGTSIFIEEPAGILWGIVTRTFSGPEHCFNLENCIREGSGKDQKPRKP